MQHLEVSGAVRPLYGSLGVKEFINLTFLYEDSKIEWSVRPHSKPAVFRLPVLSQTKHCQHLYPVVSKWWIDLCSQYCSPVHVHWLVSQITATLPDNISSCGLVTFPAEVA